jgi:hypothetical protein
MQPFHDIVRPIKHHFAMQPIHDIVVAETEADFDALLKHSATIAQFLTASDSNRFSKKNDRLRIAIQKAVITHLGEDLAESDTHIGYDWWRDHTRHIEVSERTFTFEMFELLRSMLTGEFDEWRIQAVVYSDMEASTMIGSVLIWWDKLIVDRELFDWMKIHDFGFPQAHIRSFSLCSDDLESLRDNIMNDRS